MDVGQGVVTNIAWSAALYIETVSMVPQLWMLQRIGGLDPTNIANDVVVLGVVCRMLNLDLLACLLYPHFKGLGSLGYTGWTILLLHLNQLLVLCDLIDFARPL